MSDMTDPAGQDFADPGRAAAPLALSMGPRAEAHFLERGYSLRALFSQLARYKFLILGCVVVVTLASAVAAVLMPRRYVADAMVILDTRRAEIAQQPPILSNLVSGSTADTAIVRTEVSLLGSPGFARRVIEALDLLNNPAFLREAQPGGWEKRIGDPASRLEHQAAALIGVHLDSPAPDPMGDAVLALMRNLSVHNEDRSYVIELSYQSRDPRLAADIVNTMSRLYLEDQRNRTLDVSKKAEAWARQQIAALGPKVLESERRVAQFEQEHHLQTVMTSNITEQRLQALSTQLVTATNELDRRKALLEQARALMASPDGAASAAAVLNSPVIQKLREDEADAAGRSASMRLAYRGDDPRTAMIQSKIAAEVRRIVDGLNADVQAATLTTETLRRQIAEEQAKLDGMNDARVMLVQLQHEAAATRNQLDSLLTRSQQIEADAASVETGTRVVPAEIPVKPSFPNKGLFVGFGFVGSLFLGVFLAFVADQSDETIRTPDEAASVSGVRTLGLVPRIGGGRRGHDAVLKAPLSAYANAIDNLLTMLRLPDRGGQSLVIALSSAVPREGKTQTAASIARPAAASGMRVLLIDCEMRRPGVAALFGVRERDTLRQMFAENATDLANYVQYRGGRGYPYAPGVPLLAVATSR